uniref:Uncharacterized protein n=1 Tax=Acrobeloides nanus TaxID=290746 RepID=A0A914DNG1_9BILA
MNKMANLRADPDNYPIYPMEKRLHNLSLLRMNKFSPKQDSNDFPGYGIQKRLHNLSLLRMNKFARPSIPEAKRRFFEDLSYASK